MDAHDRTASLMTPAKLARAGGSQALAGSAFLDRMAADVGHQHVHRLQELRQQLLRQLGSSQTVPLHPALQHLSQSLSLLDFSLLQNKGLWAAVTGKKRAGGTEFAAQYEALDEAAEGLSRELAHVRKQPADPAGDRALVELEVEYRALEQIIEQGARWLHDMRDQLKQRQAGAAGDPAAREQVRLDAARCETLVTRLKALRAVAGTASQLHQHLKATTDTRAALLGALQKFLGGNIREWRSRLGPLVEAAAQGSVAGLNLDGPREVQVELGRRMQALLQTSTQVREHEQGALGLLDTLGEQLSMAA